MQNNDDPTLLVLPVVGGLVALVLCGVVGLALATSHRHAPRAAAAFAAEEATPEAHLDFAAGATALPQGASDALVRIADAARSSGLIVVVAGAHDAATAVQHALEANGVSADRISLEPAAPPPLGVPVGGLRRVDIRLR